MNLVIFFEGTGQGVEGRFTNVTRLKDLCIEDAEQRLHLESGPGTRFGAYLFGKLFGADCRGILRDARRWFQQSYRSLPPVNQTISNPKPNNSTVHLHLLSPPTLSPTTRIFLFGFSRGALLARKFAEWLDKLDIPVAYLGLWDTVDSAMKIDVSEECPANVLSARHAVARDERRKYFKLIPLLARRSSESVPRVTHERGVKSNNQTISNPKSANSTRIFPGVHSDIGGLYADNHDIADATLAWIAEGAVAQGLRLVPDAKLRHDVDLTSPHVHDSFRLASNLWGLLGSSLRNFPR